MNDLLKKLNVLIKAGINDVLEDVQKTASSPAKLIPRHRLGRGIEKEVAQLREQINHALAYEDELKNRLATVEQEVIDLDRQADEAVAQGKEAEARYILERMHRAQQRYTITEADLREHQLATQELISRVNELDAAVSDARYAEEQADSQKNLQTQEPVSIPVQSNPDHEVVENPESVSKRPVLVDILREARENIEKMDDLIAAKEEVSSGSSGVTDAVEAVNTQAAIEDDIAARRARLSAPNPTPSQKKDNTSQDS